MTASRLVATASRASTGAASPFRNALIDLCFERGFASVTVADLCRRAGVGRAAFDRRYADLPDCFRQICRSELGHYRGRAATRAGLDRWPARLRENIYALYRHLAADERLRHLIFVEAHAAGECPALLLGAEIEALYDLIDEGRAEPTAPATLTRVTAESLGGGIFTQISLAAESDGPMPPEEELVPAMMYLAVLPYLGASAAAEELRIPAPPR